MDNIIAILIIFVILFFAAFYIYKQKKKGNKCIGCPYSSSCNKNSCNK